MNGAKATIGGCASTRAQGQRLICAPTTSNGRKIIVRQHLHQSANSGYECDGKVKAGNGVRITTVVCAPIGKAQQFVHRFPMTNSCRSTPTVGGKDAPRLCAPLSATEGTGMSVQQLTATGIMCDNDGTESMTTVAAGL